MNGYRLRSSQGDTIDPRQPLPVDTVEGQALVSKSETITYNGKAAAGAVTINATTIKPIVSMEGDQVASYWGNEINRVYTAYIDTFAQTKGEKNWVLSLTETNGSADVVVYDPNKDLEELFESLTTTVKRFILKATDTDGATLYGWIFGVVDATDSYTFTIANNRLTETQNWVGTLASFDNTSIEKIEIFRYNTPVAYTTGTTLTEEVPCPREYSKNWENPLVYAEGLDDGQYFVDYMRGRIIGVKADNTASETITYSVWSALATTSTSSEVDITKVGGTSTNNGGVAGSLGVGGNTAHDAVDAGNPISIGGIAKSAQQTAVATADRVKAVFNLFGEQVMAGYTWATNSLRTEEIDPLSQQYVNTSLVDTTNVSAATHYYPSSTGGTMDGYADQSLTGKFIDADETLTLTLEVTNDEDTAGDWNPIYFYDDELNATVTNKTVTNGTELFSLSVNNNNFRRYRWVVVAGGDTNTVILKERKKAL